MTILIFDDITALAHYLEHAVRTDQPAGPDYYLLDDHPYLEIERAASKLAAEIKELNTSLRALVLDTPPQYGFHLPGLITPRLVDNAERSGANLLRQLNSVNVPRRNRQAPGTP